MNTEITNIDTLSPEMKAIAEQMSVEAIAVQTEDENGNTDSEVTVDETVTVQ